MPKGAVARISPEDEFQMVMLFAAGTSARSLAKQFGMGHVKLCRILERHGLDSRDPTVAGALKRTMEELPAWNAKETGMSLANSVAIDLGYPSSTGLSKDRKFRKAYFRECRKRKANRCREIDSKRKWHLNRIPAWQDKQQIIDFYSMAHDLGLEVDHDAPLQGDNICGLNVISNLRLVRKSVNQAKQNKFVCGPDPLIGHPHVYRHRDVRGCWRGC